MPKGDGLGFVSKDFADLFRDLNGDLANKDPIELKPPYRVHRAPSRAEDVNVRFYPLGILVIKIRMAGDRLSIDEIARGEYMKWAIVESLAEALTKLVKVKVKPDSVLFCADEIEILDVQMPYMGDRLWQFCEFRFEYNLRTNSEEEAEKVVRTAFDRMVDFEAEFCKALEMKFREIYHLTVLHLINKRYGVTDGRPIWDQLALFEAATENDTATILKLVDQGVDVNATQKAAQFPSKRLDEERHFSVVALGRTPLLAAAEEGHLEALRLLLAAKADVNFRDTSGFHALYLGAGAPANAEEVVNLLLSHNADVNLANNIGYTPLHNACGCGEAASIRTLLQARGDLNLKSKTGAAPVHVAVINDQPSSVQVLREFNANLDMPAFGGNTPVHEAVMQNNPDIIQQLFDLKADINVESGPDHGFATPLRMAIDRKKKKAMKKLQELSAVEHVDHEYEDSSEDEYEPIGAGEYRPRLRVKGRQT